MMLALFSASIPRATRNPDDTKAIAGVLMLFASEILRERSLAQCTPISLIWERAKNLLNAFAVRFEADWTDCQSVQKNF